MRTIGALLAGLGAALAVLVSAAPAWAHGGDAPDGTDYRTAVTGVSPATAGLRVRAVEAGARLELTNHTGSVVEVLGYQNEPYLEVRPDGVFENVHSPAVYLNATLDGSATLPAGADATLPPSWRRASTVPVVRWHDHRSHWMQSTPPPSVVADRSRPQRIRDWVVPLRIDGVSMMEARGTLDWVPPPAAGVWWAWALLGAVVVASLGLVGRLGGLVGSLRVSVPSTGSAAPASAAAVPSPTVSAGSPPAAAEPPDATAAVPSPPAAVPSPATAVPSPAAAAASVPRWPGWVLAGVSVLAGVAAVVYAVAREIDAGNDGVGALLRGLFAGQIWPVLTGLAAIAAAVYALLRRPAADFALALAGVCVAIFAGVSNAAAFANGVVPVPWSPSSGRLLVAVAIAAGAGVAGASALRMRATAGRPAMPTVPQARRPAHDEPNGAPAVESAS